MTRGSWDALPLVIMIITNASVVKTYKTICKLSNQEKIIDKKIVPLAAREGEL